MMKRLIIIALICIIILFACLSGCSSKPDYGVAEFIVFDVEKADATLIITENHIIMIDAGENKHGRMLAEELLERGITEIDYLIITHFHKDHVGGARWLINELNVKNVIVPDYGKSSKRYEQFVDALEAFDLEQTVLKEQMSLTLDSVEMTLFPARQEYREFGTVNDDDEYDEDEDAGEVNENDFSIVISITHGNSNLLFTGDAMAPRLEELLSTEEIVQTDYDFLKIPHHGRYNERSGEFITAISPTCAAITCSVSNQPDVRVISALLDVQAVMFFTVNGNISFISDGHTLTFQ